jgi:hypothetical protein
LPSIADRIEWLTTKLPQLLQSRNREDAGNL